MHDLMDEVAEQQEIANEISEAISNPVGFGHDVDEVSLILSFPEDFSLNRNEKFSGRTGSRVGGT